jgi:hypothetical protein
MKNLWVILAIIMGASDIYAQICNLHQVLCMDNSYGKQSL